VELLLPLDQAASSICHGADCPMPPTELAADENADLLVQISSGDESAFTRFYDKFAGPLYAMLIKMLGNAQDAEEVLQLAFMQVWNRAGTFQPGRASVFTWLVIITRSKAIDRIRHRQRQSRLIDEATEEIASEGGELQAEAEKVPMSDQHEIVRNALQQIAEEQRIPIEMAFFQGMSQTEIANALSAPLGTIKARIRRGMLRLRDLLRGRL
jgi:RNA polymerase sigma-70 factor (ECF subfamily)